MKSYRSIVVERLGRAPQDGLEAAVVLEAWLGLPASEALEAGHETLTGADSPHESSRRRATGSSERSLALGDVGFVIGVLFIGFWVSHLANDLGVTRVDSAWRIALPTSLGFQWALRRRYLAGLDGLGRLRNGAREVLIPFGLLVLAGLATPGGALASALFIVWTAGFVVARRGWGLTFGIALVIGAALLGRGLGAWTIVGLATGGALGGAAMALRSFPPSARLPAPWLRSAPAAAIGAGMGLLLVVEPKFAWHASGVLPALTVVPSLVGSLWAGFHMTGLWEVLPPALADSTVSAGSTRSHQAAKVALFLLVGALLRLVTAAALASGAVMTWVIVRDEPDRRIVATLLLAHGVLAIAGLAVALVEAFGRWLWAMVAVAIGLLVSTGLHFVVSHPSPGVRILVGACAAVAVAFPPLLAILARPERTIAGAV